MTWRIKSLEAIIERAEASPLTRSLGAFQSMVVRFGAKLPRRPRR